MVQLLNIFYINTSLSAGQKHPCKSFQLLQIRDEKEMIANHNVTIDILRNTNEAAMVALC